MDGFANGVTAGDIHVGYATKAYGDELGRQIDTTYATKEEVGALDFGVTKITSNDSTTSDKDSNVSGLKITPAEGTGAVNIEIDDTITFVFDCGNALN